MQWYSLNLDTTSPWICYNKVPILRETLMVLLKCKECKTRIYISNFTQDATVKKC